MIFICLFVLVVYLNQQKNKKACTTLTEESRAIAESTFPTQDFGIFLYFILRVHN
jgi:hypothetical protein